MLVTRMPRDSRIAAREAAAIPFPRLETTPPVTNTYLVISRAKFESRSLQDSAPVNKSLCRHGAGLERDEELAAGFGADLFHADARMEFLEHQSLRGHHFEHAQVGDDHGHHALAGDR